MKKTTQILLMAGLFMTLVTPVFVAYGQADCKCGEDVRNAFDTELRTYRSSSYKSAMHTLFSKNYEFWQKYESSSEKTSELDAGFTLFNWLGLSGSNLSDEKKKEFKETFERKTEYFNTNNSLSTSDEFTLYQRLPTSSEHTLEAYKACLNRCNDNTGIKFISEGNKEGSEFIITLNWEIAGRTHTPVMISDINLINAEQTSGSLIKGATLKPSGSLTGKIKRKDSILNVIVIIDIEKVGTRTITIPKYIKPESPKIHEVPIGTIIASILPYEIFCKVSGETSTMFNDKTSKWAPADGRSVANSDFGGIQNNVPDLRGVFLRGLNQFYYGAQTLNPNQADPEKRDAGQFQADIFKSHKHPLTNRGFRKDFSPRNNQDGAEFTKVNDRPLFDINDLISVEEVGGAETRPKNIAVYYYIRINN